MKQESYFVAENPYQSPEEMEVENTTDAKGPSWLLQVMGFVAMLVPPTMLHMDPSREFDSTPVSLFWYTAYLFCPPLAILCAWRGAGSNMPILGLVVIFLAGIEAIQVLIAVFVYYLDPLGAHTI